MKRSKAVVAILALALLAVMLPPGTAEAKVGDTAAAGHVSVDTFYQWAVTGDTASQTVQLDLYNLASGTWTSAGTVSNLGTSSFGHSVAISGAGDRNNPMIIVGAPDVEAVYVYRFNSTTNLLEPLNTIFAPNTTGNSRFGASVDLDSGNLVVGAPGAESTPGAADAQGTAYTWDVTSAGFSDPSTSFTEVTVAGLTAGSELGSVVQVEDDVAWLAAPGFSSDAGQVYGYNVISNLVVETLVNPGATTRFGSSLSVDPSRQLVGSKTGNPRLYSAGVSTEIVLGVNSTLTGDTMDVALEGNLLAVAVDQTASGVATAVEVLTNNGDSPTSFSPFTAPAIGEVREIVLGSGWLHVSVPPVGASPARVSAPMSDPDPAVASKYVPQIGVQQTGFGNYTDLDEATLISLRNARTADSQLVVSINDASGWSPTGFTAYQFIDLAGSAHNSTINGDVIAVSLFDGSSEVAVYERADVNSPFLLNERFFTSRAEAARGLAIDETGRYLAVGYPGSGVVDVYDNAAGGWGADPPAVINPQDQALTGSSTTFGWDLDFGDGSLLIGQPNQASLVLASGAPGLAELWTIDGDTTTFIDTLVPTNTATGDTAGWTVEIEEGIRAVGSPRLNTVQTWRTDQSDELLTDPSPPGSQANWGYAMDLDSGVLAVTDWLGDTATYDVYSTGLTQTGTFQSPDLEPSDLANSSFPVATSQGGVVVGARAEDIQGRDAGAIYVFTAPTSQPPVVARTWPVTVDIDNGTAVVGNPDEDLVHVLRNTGNGWNEVQQLVGVADTAFGAGIALQGDVLIVGSPEHAAGSGLINRYDRNPTGGLFTASASFATNPATAVPGVVDEFGAHIDFAGNSVVVGSPSDVNGSAIVYPLDFTSSDGEVIVADPGGSVTVASFGASVATGFDRFDQEYLWVGAPDEGAGFVYGYAFNDNSGLWQPIDTIEGDATGDRYGAHIAADRFYTLISAPNAAGTDNVELVRWSSQQADRDGLRPAGAAVGGIALNGNVDAVALTGNSSVAIRSDNGQSLSSIVGATAADTTNGDSVAIDGDWLITSDVDAAGTDWTQLVELSRISSVGTLPNTPANKNVPDFGSDGAGYGSVVDGGEDIYVVASPGNATRGAPGTIAVRDAATNVVVQTIVAPAVVDGDFRDVYLDGDRLAVLQLHAVGAGAAVGTPGVEILQRVGPGAAFDIPGWQLPIADATSIALDGDRLVVGRAPLDDVQVYDFVGGTWNLTATLTPQFIDTSAAFGADVDLAGDVIMIGTDFPDSTDAGYVTAFSLDPIDGWIENSTRIQGTELVLGDPDDVGTAISFDGNWLVVGAADEDGNGGTFSPSTGFVYIFPHTSDGNVGTAQTLDPASEIGGDNGDAAWGTSVDLRGDVLVAGGPGWENPANSAKSGAIISYRYDSADGAWVANGFDEGTGVPSDGEFGDRFGTSAALAGNPLTAMTAIGGAPGEDASGIDAGASYTFTSPAPFFPAGPPNRLISNSLSSDGFGRHIDIDGTVAVVAEHDGGSAEIYDLVGTAWVFRQRLDNVADSIRDVSLDGDRMVLIDRIGNELMQFELSGSTFVAAGTRSYGGTGVPESVVLDGDDIFIGLANSINNEPLKHELWAGGSVAVPTLVDDVNGHETGWSIAKDANLVFVGARRWDSNAGVAEAGRVYIYDTDTSSWTGTIEADGPGTLFGSDLAVSGGRLAVGYPGGEGPRFGGATTAATGVVEIYTNLTPTGATLEQVVSGSNQDVADSFGSKIDISGNVLIVGSNAAAYDGVRRGQAVAFSYGNGTWSETATFRSDADSTGTDQFGHDVAISGEAVLVGAFQHDNARGTDAGAAYWHFVPQPEVDGKLISEPGSDTIDGESGDGFASAISSDGSRLVVGAPENIDLASLLSLNGGVYVYTAGAAGWEFEQFIENPTGNQEENFGAAVAVEGDTLVVGSPTAGATQQGTAWVIDLAGAQAPVELVPGPGSGITDNSEFGSAVDIDGDTAVIGSPGPVGAAPGVAVTRATIWQNVGSTWQLVGDVADTSSDDQRSGSTVAIDGDLVAVGAPSGGFTPGIGYVDIWRQTTPGAWTALANTRLFGLTGERFGQDVDVQTSNLGDVVVVGVPGGNQASLFTYDDSAGWDAGQALVAPGGVTTTFLGSSVAIDGTIVVTGDSDSQRAVAFENSAYRVWTPLTDFQAADGELFDAFGSTAAVAGGNIVIGAPVDSNGNGTYAGAAYEFEVTPPAAPTAPPVTFDPVFIADLSYELPTSVMPGATSVTVEGVSVASTAAGNGASSGVVAASIGAIDLSAPEAANNQLGDITLGDLGIDVGGLGLDALRQIPLTEFPVDGGWNQYLPPQFAGVPLQAITLADVWDNANVQSIPLRFSDIDASPLRFSDIAAIGFGSIELLDIDLDGDDSTAPFDEWCTTLSTQGTSCADLGITDSSSTVTLGSVSAAGVNVEATPLRFSPLRFSYIEASPLRFSPLRFSDIEASPLRFSPLRFSEIESAPLRFSPLRFSPLRFSPLRFSPLRFSPLRFSPLRFSDINATPLRFSPLRFSANPAAIADCAIVNCDDDNLTLGDVALAGALRDDFTLNDLGDAILADYRVDDLLAGLTQGTIDDLEAAIDTSGSTFEDLLNEFGVDGLGEMTLGDLDPEIWESITFTIGDFFEGYDDEELAKYSLSDFLLLFVPRDAYEWNDVDLGSINLQLAGMQAALPASVAFTTGDGAPVEDVTVVINLPAGAVVQPNSFALAATGASIVGTAVDDTTATVSIINVASGEPQTLTFGLFQGLELGTQSSVLSATAGASSQTASDSITVVEAFEPANNTLAGATAVISDNLYVSHLGTAGDTDFFRLTVTEPATSVSVQLSNLAADYDLVVYGPRLTSILPAQGGGAASAPTTDFDASSTGGVLSPVPLQDLPNSLDELQVYGASYFRGTDAEQVDFLATEPADYFVQITGYLGASSPEPYSLRAATTPTTELSCPARTFQFPAGTPGNSTSAAGADTLVLMNSSRFEALYGPTAAADMITATNAMISTAASNGVNASVIDLDGLPGVQAAYDAWDASPCSTIAVNNVVSGISNAILGLRASAPVANLLIIGGDDVVPFGRVKDTTTIANEQSYTNTFTAASNNALRQAFAGSWVLTDDPYADSAPTQIDNSDRVVYVPEVAMGRLVETPTEIIGSLDNYVTFGGQLDPQTGFVAGYDFLDDGTELAGDNLDDVISPSTVQRLINETWTASQLEAGLATSPDTALVSAHFDHANALPAAGNASGSTTDLFDVEDAELLDFTGSILFSVGCHGGLSVSDLLVAPTGVVSQDWAQTFLGGGAAAFVANTGYGYGDDTAVALSEKLMADFAAGLGEYDTVGEALLYAKQEYAADLTVYGAFDEKALMEATLYGIPFYTLGNARVPEPVPEPPTEPAPTGGVSYTDDFAPILQVTGDGTEDEVWSTLGSQGESQVQVTSGYPILPRFEWEVTQQDPADPTRLALDARGVMLESLVTTDEIDVDPATARAVYDLAANEPNTDASDVTFALAPSISTYLTPEGIRQDVTMAVGAFQTSNAATGAGTMRLYEQFGATVYYADSPGSEANRPVITGAQATATASGDFNLAVSVTDDSDVVRVTALVSATPIPNAPTTWELIEFTQAGGDIWQGSGSIIGSEIQWLIMAADTHGNTAWSMSKELAFDGAGGSDPGPALFNPAAPEGEIQVGTETALSVELWDFNGSIGTVNVEWNFGDGTTCDPASDAGCDIVAPSASEPLGSTSATHIYTAPGTYPVTVTATDGAGQTASISLGPIVVTEESLSTGRARVFGASRTGRADGDIAPSGVAGRNMWIKLRADNRDELRLQTMTFSVWRRFFFQGQTISSIEFDADVATIEGTGQMRLRRGSAESVNYRVIVDDVDSEVVLSVWNLADDPNVDAPQYVLTTSFRWGWSVDVRTFS